MRTSSLSPLLNRKSRARKSAGFGSGNVEAFCAAATALKSSAESSVGTFTRASVTQGRPLARRASFGGQPSRVIKAKVGGRQEARTPDLRVANAALSQLS